MRALVQRTSRCSVRVGGEEVSAAGPGILVLLGIADGDTKKDSAFLARKTAALRIFEDQMGKMNLSIREAGGQAMVVSQFTLVADTRKGNRPGFGPAMPPDGARVLYEHFIEELSGHGIGVQTGQFGAGMEVELVNSGPVTFLLESRSQESEIRNQS